MAGTFPRGNTLPMAGVHNDQTEEAPKVMFEEESKALIPAPDNTHQQEVPEPDEIQHIGKFIEAANEQTALERMHELILEQGRNYIEQGGLLKMMQDQKQFYGHKTFRALCQEEFGFHHGKGRWLVRVFEKVVEAKLTWADIEGIGWTKMRAICPKVEAEDLPMWVDKAKSMTVLQLEAAVNDELGYDAEKAQKLKMVGFYPNQWEMVNAAIEKLKHEHGPMEKPIENSEAIMGILTEYVGSPMSAPQHLPANPSEKTGGEIHDELAALIKKTGPKHTVEVLTATFPEWTFKAYPPCDGDGLAHNGQSGSGNNVDPEVGGSKPAKNQVSDHLDTSADPASGNGGVAIEPPPQYEMPPVPDSLVRTQPDDPDTDGEAGG